MKSTAVMSVMAALSLSVAAKTTVFVGHEGDGDVGLFSAAANWDNGVPAEGDDVQLSPAYGYSCISNDIADLKLDSLTLSFTNGTTVVPVLKGEKIAVEKKIELYDGAELHCDVTADGTYISLEGGDDSSIYGDVFVAGDCRLYISDGKKINIYGAFDVEGKISNTVRAGYRNGAVWFHSADNSFGSAPLWYQNFRFFKENAFNPDLVIEWDTAWNSGNLGFWEFYSDQTADRIITPDPEKLMSATKREIQGIGVGGTGVLTLNGTADASAFAEIRDSLSIVWNPSGTFRQTFTNRASVTTGKIEVKSGAVEIAAGASFSNLTAIAVHSGATFDLTTDIATSLASLASLNLDGTFIISASAGNPFGDGILDVRVGGGGQLSVPAGVTLRLASVWVDGAYLAVGSYASSDCAWLTGGGAVEVVQPNIWKTAVDGSWSDTAKWTGGVVPAAGADVDISATNADYTVAYDRPTVTAAGITVDGRSSSAARLLFNDDCSLAENGGTIFKVMNGGVVEIAGGTVAFTNGSDWNVRRRLIDIMDGGIWRVSGGVCHLDVFGTPREPMMYVQPGGRLEVSGGRLFLTNSVVTYSPVLRLNGGTIEVSGNGCLDCGQIQGESNILFGSGDIVVKDSGLLQVDRLMATPSSTNVPLRISLQDDSAFTNLSAGSTGVILQNGTTELEFRNSGGNLFSWGLYHGVNKTATSRLKIADGAKLDIKGGDFFVASVSAKTDLEECRPKAYVDVSNGLLNVECNWYETYMGTKGASSFCAAVIGGSHSPISRKDGAEKSMDELGIGYSFTGEVNITENGQYAQKWGHLFVGFGKHANGTVRMDSGTFSKTASGETVIGAFGGSGTFSVVGGEATFNTPVYVGGIATNMFAYPRWWQYTDGDTLVSTGIVSVAGGMFTAAAGMTVGAFGTGTLEIGGVGVIDATSLVFTNHVQSTLAFKFGADGIGRLKAGGITNAPGTRLVIDTRNYTGSRTAFRLVECKSIAGDFDDVEIESGTRHFAVQRDKDGLRGRFTYGTTVIVR